LLAAILFGVAGLLIVVRPAISAIAWIALALGLRGS